MPLRSSALAVMRVVGSAGVTGTACFAVAFLAHTTDPWTILGGSAVAVLCAGGRLAAWDATLSMRIACGVAAVLLVRASFGRVAAAPVAVLLVVGAALRVRLRDLRYGLAAVGATVALVGRANVGVILTFWLVGFIAALVWRISVMTRCWCRRRRDEKLGPSHREIPGVTVIWS